MAFSKQFQLLNYGGKICKGKQSNHRGKDEASSNEPFFLPAEACEPPANEAVEAGAPKRARGVIVMCIPGVGAARSRACVHLHARDRPCQLLGELQRHRGAAATNVRAASREDLSRAAPLRNIKGDAHARTSECPARACALCLAWTSLLRVSWLLLCARDATLHEAHAAHPRALEAAQRPALLTTPMHTVRTHCGTPASVWVGLHPRDTRSSKTPMFAHA